MDIFSDAFILIQAKFQKILVFNLFAAMIEIWDLLGIKKKKNRVSLHSALAMFNCSRVKECHDCGQVRRNIYKGKKAEARE